VSFLSISAARADASLMFSFAGGCSVRISNVTKGRFCECITRDWFGCDTGWFAAKTGRAVLDSSRKRPRETKKQNQPERTIRENDHDQARQPIAARKETKTRTRTHDG
jgi:hypothetical protein